MPDLAVKNFVRKPFNVEAVQVTAENMPFVADWCKGEVQEDGDGAGRFVKVAVRRPLYPRQTQAFVGDWVLQAGAGFRVYTDSAFLNNFNEVL
jgi:hypothetical protein